jgi:DNA repair exonuclease SbcCD ATPase subunit
MDRAELNALSEHNQRRMNELAVEAAERRAREPDDEPVRRDWTPPSLRKREPVSQSTDWITRATLQATVDGLADYFVAREFLDDMLHFLAQEMGQTERRAIQRQNDEVAALRAELAAMRQEVAELRDQVDGLQSEVAALADDLGDVERAAKSETTSCICRMIGEIDFTPRMNAHAERVPPNRRPIISARCRLWFAVFRAVRSDCLSPRAFSWLSRCGMRLI